MDHAQIAKAVSYRMVGPEGSKTKEQRCFDVLMPKADGEQFLGSRYLADAEQNSPAWALRILQAIQVGLPLVAQAKAGVWADKGKPTAAKVNLYVLTHAAESPYREWLAAEPTQLAEAQAQAKADMASSTTSGDAIGDDEAEQLKAEFKALWESIHAKARKTLGIG